jgi:hypothetical protein
MIFSKAQVSVKIKLVVVLTKEALIKEEWVKEALIKEEWAKETLSI